jgi:hypothetical protein
MRPPAHPAIYRRTQPFQLVMIGERAMRTLSITAIISVRHRSSLNADSRKPANPAKKAWAVESNLQLLARSRGSISNASKR